MAKKRLLSNRSAAVQLAAAREELDRARERLASTVDDGVALAGEWKRLHFILRARASDLERIPGVVGHGLGYRRRGDVELPKPCIVVFVKKKRTDAALKRSNSRRVPRTVSHKGERATVDVIELGTIKPAGVTGSIGPVQPVDHGTIGVAGWDIASGKTVVITAMHVMRRRSYIPSPTEPPVYVTVPSLHDDSRAAAVGFLGLGTTNGFDAVKVFITDAARVRRYLPPVALKDWRRVSADINIVVHMFGKASNRQLSGVIKYTHVGLPQWRLQDTIITEGIPATYGDSGAALFDNSGYVLGFLFGVAPPEYPQNHRVFCPAELVMPLLGCRMRPE